MTHIVIGYPTLAASRELVLVMAETGVDFIELQIPFSDPMADGPTLMRANQTALEQGTTVREAMELMAELTVVTKIPLLFMTYFNIAHHYGTARFCRDARRAGCSGLIVPDIPLDEEKQEGFIHSAEENGLIAIRVLSPASTKRRLKLNVPLARGFVYFTARQGITGAQATLDPALASHLAKLKEFFHIPIAVGFGIAKPEHISALKGKAEIAVAGSEVINIYNSSKKGEEVEAVKRFVSSLVAAGR